MITYILTNTHKLVLSNPIRSVVASFFFSQLISLSVFFILLFRSLQATIFAIASKKKQQKLIRTIFFPWTDQEKRVISLIESHGNHFNCQIVRLLRAWCFLHSSQLLLLRVFFWPLSKIFNSPIWFERKIGGVMPRPSLSKPKLCVLCSCAHVSSFHDSNLYAHMQRINSQVIYIHTASVPINRQCDTAHNFTISMCS